MFHPAGCLGAQLHHFRSIVLHQAATESVNQVVLWSYEKGNLLSSVFIGLSWLPEATRFTELPPDWRPVIDDFRLDLWLPLAKIGGNALALSLATQWGRWLVQWRNIWQNSGFNADRINLNRSGCEFLKCFVTSLWLEPSVTSQRENSQDGAI